MFLHRKIAFSLAAAILLIGVCVTVRTLVRCSDHAEWIAIEQADFTQLGGLLSAMRDAETGQRGYALTRDPKFLEPYESGVQDARRDLAGVQAGLGSKYVEPVRQLSAAVDHQIAYLESVIHLTKYGQGQEVVLSAAQGKANMDGIRKLVGDMSIKEAKLLEERQHRFRRMITEAIATVCISLGLALLLCGAALAKMFADLRARTLAEGALQASQESLEERVTERTEQLAASNLRLQGMVRALDRESDRRAALQEELRVSNQRFQSAFENAAIGMGQAAPDGRFVMVNRRLCEIVGYPEEELLGRTFVTLTHPDDADENELLAHRLWVGEIPYYTQRKRYLRRDGTPVWIAVTVSLIRELSGEPQFYIGAVQEIEKEMESERKLLDSETRYRFMADSMPQIVFTAGSDGTIEYVNHRWVEYAGITIEEAQAAGWEIILHLEDVERYNDRWAHAMRTGIPFQCEARFRGRDGAYRWHLGRALPLRDEEGRVTRWFGTCTDIDDQKAAENKVRSLNESLERRVADRTADLAQSQERFRSLVEGVKDYAILMLDSLGRVCSWTEGARRIHGYTAEEILGKHFSCFYLEEEKRAGSPYANLRKAQSDGTFEQEGWRICKDGSRFWASVLITALYNEDGSLRGYSKIVRDVSERRQAEEMLTNKTAELEAMNADLVVLTKRAEQASEAKSNFLAAMSHEIRTPMNAILGMADLLWESKLDDEQRRYVEVFRRAGNNLLSLINDILDLSKIESGTFELEQIAFDLGEVFDRTMELIEPRARAKGLELISRYPANVETALVGDPVRLQQILINLLGNAVKFTEKGKIVLTAKQADRNRGELFISVSDTGIGIEQDKLEHIFGDFTQADSSTTRRFGGTGLGLGIARRLVRLMGGELSVKSNPGCGSIFSFSAHLSTAEQGMRIEPRSIDDLHGKRVLIIDDNATNRLIVRETLLSWGMEAGECDTAAAGTAEVERALGAGYPYSLILVDSRMPGAGGFDAIASIRKIAPSIPIVMLASDSLPGDATRCQEFNLAGYAVKPIKRPQLLRLICGAMASRPEDARQELELASDGACRKRDPLRLLIAEDSLDNRILLEAYLHSGPYQVTFAENGQAAAECFEAGSYDLVLMDMQMPVIDGLSATRLIRACERARGLTPTPILALTANALQRDVAAVLDAGCNSHLSKPISKGKLISAIEQWAGNTSDSKANEPELHEEIDIPPGLEEHAKVYIENRKQEIATLHRLFARSEFERVRTIAHNIKGSGTSFGFPALTRIGGELEDSALRSDAVAVDGQLMALANYLTKASAIVGSIA